MAALVSLHISISGNQISPDMKANREPATVQINGDCVLILDSLISESIEYYSSLCESTFQSKCLPE